MKRSEIPGMLHDICAIISIVALMFFVVTGTLYFCGYPTKLDAGVMGLIFIVFLALARIIDAKYDL